MKKPLCFSIFIFILIFTYCSLKADDNQAHPIHGNGYFLLRGISNVGLGWLELPQEMLYQSVKLPVVGIISGVGIGSALFVWRSVGGLMDIASLGFDGGRNFFREIPDFPWNDAWLPPEKKH